LDMENTMEKRPVNIYLEKNPNPNSLKFCANFMLVPEGDSFDFPDAQSAQHAPLAKELFNFPFVERVFYMNNFVTVTKAEGVEWEDVQIALRDYIKEYLEEGKKVIDFKEVEKEQAQQSGVATDGSEIDIKIKGILDEYIKPAVEMDGGAIQYHSFNEGTVKVLLQGSCSGCPSSMITLKQGIENLLKSMMPEVKEVVAEGV
jgi:Fe-S cluster biogenesis protein NfuA